MLLNSYSNVLCISVMQIKLSVSESMLCLLLTTLDKLILASVSSRKAKISGIGAKCRTDSSPATCQIKGIARNVKH